MLLAFFFGLTVPLGLDTYLPAPDGNPITPEKAALGRALFRDRALSRDRSISCATCHDAGRAFTDDKPLAIGVDARGGNRRTPTIVNRAFGKSFFWDGRVKTLEEQVVQPITNPREMDLPLESAVARVRHHNFRAVFGREANAADLAAALATYVRTILSGDAPYDRYVAGERTALTTEAIQGLQMFRGKAGCIACHVGFNFSDEKLHDTGSGLFKTPTLREVAGRAPYMHDGSLNTLDEVIDLYDKGGKKVPSLDPEIRPLRLSPSEKKALREFLRALSGRIQEGYRGAELP
ncbi:MAG TPA: cytochrome c peroxidase [Bryobacteraceae bacterium]|nr:cytochrome c peroxidase [Bryobacteraceae bacterium]